MFRETKHLSEHDRHIAWAFSTLGNTHIWSILVLLFYNFVWRKNYGTQPPKQSKTVNFVRLALTLSFAPPSVFAVLTYIKFGHLSPTIKSLSIVAMSFLVASAVLALCYLVWLILDIWPRRNSDRGARGPAPRGPLQGGQAEAGIPLPVIAVTEGSGNH